MSWNADGTVFEVRTTGADTNGGAYSTAVGVPGTDFSQQNAAQYSFADLASANGNAAAPAVTSASHVFVAADVGNSINISGAGVNFITGIYMINSVAGGAATLDRACGTAAACSGGTYAVGGALLTPQKAWTAAVNCTIGSNDQKGAIIWLKVGTYSTTTLIDIGLQQYTSLQGYDAARGDDTGNRPLVTTSTSSIDLMKHNGNFAGNLYFDNVNFSNTAVTPGIGIWVYTNSAMRLYVRRSKWSGFTNAINGDNAGARFQYQAVFIQACEFTSCTSDVVILNGTPCGCWSSYFHGNASGKKSLRSTTSGNAGSYCSHNIFDGGSGVDMGGISCIVEHNDFINSSADGCIMQSSNNNCLWIVSNNIFYGNGGTGLNLLTPSTIMLTGFNNAYGSNTTANVSTGLKGLLGNITLTASPFNSSSDYTLNGTAGGGALCKAAGYAMVFNAATTHPDVGAVQSGAAVAAAPAAYAFLSR